MNALTEINTKLAQFLDSTPSPFHAIANVSRILTENGFTELHALSEPLKVGGRYFITKNRSSLIAFTVPQTVKGFMIAASHSDSPSFKIKDNAEVVVDKKYVKLNTERYGGMLFAPWFDRPLSVAGKVLFSNGNTISTRLVNIDRNLLLIPNVAIHMNRKANDGYEYKANVDSLPLFGGADAAGSFMRLVAENADIDESAIVGTDLYLCCREKSTIWGANNEFFSAPRLDDLQCAFTTLAGFLRAVPKNTHSSVYCLFDNEEIGSDTKQGAGSPLLYDVLRAISGTTDISDKLENSFMLSCDNAHAVHPNHTELADSSNRPYLNGGVVVKYGIRYATDSVSEAVFKHMMNLSGIPYQTYSNRSDMPGGATLGNISGTKVAVNTVDIGLAQLAMHSPYETAGAEDNQHMTNAAEVFFSSRIIASGDGEYTVEL